MSKSNLVCADWATHKPLQIVIDEHYAYISVCVRTLQPVFDKTGTFNAHGSPVNSVDVMNRADAVKAINGFCDKHSNVVGVRFYGGAANYTQRKSYKALDLKADFLTENQFKKAFNLEVAA